MEIFDYERMDGIAMLVMANSSVSSLSKLVPMNKGRAIARSLTSGSVSIEISDPGLFFMEDILVSTGENLNTDFFDRLEVWNARETPAHKPLNFEHDDLKIIGHIVSTQVVDEKYEAIAHDTDFDEVPEKFHILNGSVIYKIWSNETQQELIDATIEEIEAGEWYVSMECVFRGFDYVITTPDGDRIIVARTQDSAFLTKHLRQYGGTGTFTDKSTGAEYKLARLLKNIAFSGKGLVKRPANPESEILVPDKEKSSQDKTTSQDLGYISSEANSDTSSEAMELNTMTENEIKLLQDKLVAMEADNKALKSRLDEVSGQAVQAKITSLESDVQTKATEVSQLQTQLSATKEAVDALTKRAEAAESELVTVKAAQKRSERLSTLVSKGASKEQSETLVAKFENLTDEQFASIVDTLAVAWKAAAMDDEEEASEDDEEDNDKKGKKGKKPKTDASTVIDNATVVTEPNLATSSVAPSASEKLEKTAAYLSNFLKYSKPK